MALTAFTNQVLVSFTDDALHFTEEGRAPVSIPYREYPEVFGHPRFLMADLQQGAQLVNKAMRQLKGGRFPLLAPKFIVSINRPLPGGITEIDRKSIREILDMAGARKVEFKDA